MGVDYEKIVITRIYDDKINLIDNIAIYHEKHIQTSIWATSMILNTWIFRAILGELQTLSKLAFFGWGSLNCYATVLSNLLLQNAKTNMEPFHLEIVVNFATTARAVWCAYPAVNMIPLYTLYLILPAPTHATCNIILTKIIWLTDWPPFLQVNHTPASYPKTTRNLPISNDRFLPETPEQGTCRASWLYASTRASDVVSGWIPGDWRIPFWWREKGAVTCFTTAPKKSIFIYRDTYSTVTQDGMNYHTKKNIISKKKSWVYIIKPEVDPFSSSDPELIVS